MSLPHAGPPGPPRQSRTGVVVSIAAAAVALLTTLGVGVWNFVISPVPNVTARPTTETGGPTIAPTTSAPQPTTAPPTTADPVPSTTAPPEPDPTTPPTTEPPPPPPPPPPAFPAGARTCPATTGDVGGFTQSAVGTDVTSCPFAEEVRISYGSNPVRNAPVTIPAYSPVTQTQYEMRCSGDRLVTCTGGNNAVVYLI